MTKSDYQSSMREYIDALEGGVNEKAGTREEWKKWIQEDVKETIAEYRRQGLRDDELKEVSITEQEIEWIIEILEDEGYVKEEA